MYLKSETHLRNAQGNKASSANKWIVKICLVLDMVRKHWSLWVALLRFGLFCCDMVKHELRVASYELLVTSSKLKSSSWNSKVRVEIQIHELRVGIYELQVGIHELQVRIHELRVRIHELWVRIHELRVWIHEFKNH